MSVMALCLALGGAVAQAATRGRVNQTIKLGTLTQGAKYPSPGSSAVFAGTVRSGLGRGTIVQTITITGHPRPATFVFRGTSTAFYPHGTTRGAFTGTGTLLPGGRFTLAGHGHYTGGTLYRRVRGKYSFVGTAPLPPSIPACPVPAGSHVVASNGEVVVIFDGEEYRYCDYPEPRRGFQFLVRDDNCGGAALGGTCVTIDGVALSDILYHATTFDDSPVCNGFGTPVRSSVVYAVDAASGKAVTLDQGGGTIASAGLSPVGVGAWIRTEVPCTPSPSPSGHPRSESLKSVSLRSGGVTTLDTGDPGETDRSSPSLANLQLYQCAAGCPANTVVVAWTHDGAWRYQQAG